MKITKTGQIVALTRGTNAVDIILANGTRVRVPFRLLAGSGIWLKIDQHIEVTGQEDHTQRLHATSLKLIADVPNPRPYRSALYRGQHFADELLDLIKKIFTA